MSRNERWGEKGGKKAERGEDVPDRFLCFLSSPLRSRGVFILFYDHKGHHVENDSQVMKHAAGEDEYMKDSVVMRDPVPRKEDHAK